MPRTPKFTKTHVLEAKAKAKRTDKPVKVHVSDVERLYLKANPDGTTRFFYRYTVPKVYRGSRGLRKQPVTEIHVGRPGLNLNKAKGVARQYAEWLNDGRDPLEIMSHKRAEEMTFAQLAKQWIEHNKFKPKRLQDARNLLLVHGKPLANETLIRITPEKIHSALAALWNAHDDQAKRAQVMIEHLLDYARVKRLRAGDNPARWRGNLQHLFPKRQRIAGLTKHHGSMPFQQVPAFLQELRTHRGSVAVALEFCILTATRTEETIGARWSEVDWTQRIWTVPAERTKTKKEQHRVPLSDRTIELLKRQKERSVSEFVFPGNIPDQPLGNRTMYFLLRTMVPKGTTVHGFRTSFRVWCAELHSDFGNFAAVEKCLGHSVGSATSVQPYYRTDLLKQRRPIMDAWAAYLG